ncbi:MAG: 50S ribosomal protein L3 [Anaerolineae bacterium]|nr:50S ribosomal protein L3 [Anaerolineae bacterium]
MKGIIGKKVGMTQIFDDRGEVVPVTVIEAGPCYVAQVKTVERDGYSAVQLGFDEVKPKRLTRPQVRHLQKSNLPALRYLREITVDPEDVAGFEEGQKLTVGIFEAGEYVDVSGTSKGRGFAGVVKRHGFSGGPKTHGQSDRHRAPGSIGACTTPGRVFKGKRMPGRMGGDRVTVQNLEVVLVDPERNLLAVRGAVPGAKNGLVLIEQARKTRVLKRVRK